MSYDGWIEIDIPGDDPGALADLGNYTSNVARMWTWCLSFVTESPLRLSETDGWSCDRAAPVLAKAVTVMEAERPRLEAWNPENGWGDYDGALTYLRNVAEQAQRFAPIPGSHLRWWV